MGEGKDVDYVEMRNGWKGDGGKYVVNVERRSGWKGGEVSM